MARRLSGGPVSQVWYWGPVIATVVAILYYAIRPYDVPGDLTAEDKICHAAAFGSFAFLLWRALRWGHRWPWWAALGMAAMVGAAFGGAIEGIQLYVPGRSSDPKDFVADMVGVASVEVCIVISSWLANRCQARRARTRLIAGMRPRRLDNTPSTGPRRIERAE